VCGGAQAGIHPHDSNEPHIVDSYICLDAALELYMQCNIVFELIRDERFGEANELIIKIRAELKHWISVCHCPSDNIATTIPALMRSVMQNARMLGFDHLKTQMGIEMVRKDILEQSIVGIYGSYFDGVDNI